MPAIQRGEIVIAYAGMVRQHKRISDPKKFPRGKAGPLAAFQSEHIHHALMKNLWAHQPTPGRRPRLLLYLAAEKLIVIHIVSVARVAQLFLQLGRPVLAQFFGHPACQRCPFRLRRLLLPFGRRHILEE